VNNLLSDIRWVHFGDIFAHRRVGGPIGTRLKTSMVLTSNAPLGHMLCGKVFEWFRDGLGRFLNAEAKIKRERVDLWECSFYLRNVFNGCVFHLGCPKRNTNRMGFRSGFKLGVVMLLGLFGHL